jgi:hypothetical protein
MAGLRNVAAVYVDVHFDANLIPCVTARAVWLFKTGEE